jgi:hypothetical protein
MSSVFDVRRLALIGGFLLISVSLPAQTRTGGEPEKEETAEFFRSIAASIYKLAWPTATYRDIEFGGFRREPGGLAVIIKLSGEGLFEKNLWLKLGIIVNRNGIEDIKVMGHNAMFVPPFETSKTMAKLLAEVGQQYAKRQSASAGVGQAMAGAVCLINSTSIKLNFVYRWGTGEWQKGEVEPGGSQWFAWKYATAEHVSPVFEIAYDNSLAEGITDQRYVLDRTASRLPVTCDQSSRYNFSLNGDTVLLNAIR